MIIRNLLHLFAFTGLTSGGTLVVSSLPDEIHALAPLTSRSGVALDSNTVIHLGAIPGMDDDALLDLAAESGYPGIDAAFIPFATPAAMGAGADAAAGRFEIALREVLPLGTSPLIGEEITILIVQNDGEEFLAARFPGEIFTADTDEALESFTILHLANARVVAGNRYGSTHITTSPPPAIGSFAEWIAGFPSLTDPSMTTPEADPDGDGRSNFLEYATGGNPTSGAETPLSRLVSDGEGGWWFHFLGVPGLGAVRYQAMTSENLSGSWTPLPGMATPADASPGTGAAEWMKVAVPDTHPASDRRFFRLKVSRE